MTSVRESIPRELEREVECALEWFNGTQDVVFEVTGMVDAESTLGSDGVRELRLILCGGDRCEQRTFRVTPRAPASDEFEVVLLDDDSRAILDADPPAELDPPPGARRGWLDRVLGRHAFVVLVFYRGYW